MDDKRHAGIELTTPAPVSAEADLVIGDDAASPSGLVIDDDATSSSGLVINDDAEGAPARPAASFGAPMALSFADAQRISDGRLETSKILGLLDHDALARMSDREVQVQVARFLKKLSAMEMQFGDLQKARGKLVGYRAWLDKIRLLEKAPDASQRLRLILEAEERSAAT
jgi:hypothetical protein